MFKYVALISGVMGQKCCASLVVLCYTSRLYFRRDGWPARLFLPFIYDSTVPLFHDLLNQDSETFASTAWHLRKVKSFAFQDERE